MQVNSLVCWGGRLGKTVTLTIASPCVVTSTNHGLRDGARLVFSTTGALPTGITAGTTYYAKSTAENTFNLYTDAALTSIVNTSGTQSGTHTAKSVLMGEYFAQHSGRWGDAGSERCYDGLNSWYAARGSAGSSFDKELCEIGEWFSEAQSAGLVLTMSCAVTEITTRVNGVRSEAYHYGNFNQGYRLRTGPSVYTDLSLNTPNSTLDGFSLSVTWSGYAPTMIALNAISCTVMNMVLYNEVSAKTGLAFYVFTSACWLVNNLIYGVDMGIQSRGVNYYVHNTVNGSNGFANPYGGTTIPGYFYNNISYGNTTNWGAYTGQNGAAGNAGASGDTVWDTVGGTSVVVADSDFMDIMNATFSARNYRPTAANSPQVDTARLFYGYDNYPFDITGGERPNYNNGGAEGLDIGCYEFDHGFGNHPATATISLSNIVSGSRVLITRDDTSAVLYNDVPGSSLSFVTGYIGNFSVVIRKASESPYYREFSAGGTTVADQTTSIKALQQLDE